MKVNLNDLKVAFDIICAHLMEIRGDNIEINSDYYWDVVSNERYDPYVEPSELSVGQLSDDLNKLLSIVGGQSLPVGYDFVYLAALLRAVGEETVS